MIPDEELRARFAELKRVDASGAPDYATIRTRSRRTSSPWRVTAALASVAAAALVVMWCGASSIVGTEASPVSAPRVEPRGGLIGGEARRAEFAPAPLDFLLAVPEAAHTRTAGLDSNPIEGW